MHWVLNKTVGFFTVLALALTGYLGSGHSASATEATETEKAPVVLVVGDSLSAEYGIQRGTGWVQHLQEKLDEHGFNYRIENASISGDTTSGGLSRLPDALARVQPAIVILELGSNDALRGLSLGMTRSNLDEMIKLVRGNGAEPLLVGMQIPPNYGRQYTEQFIALYADLAQSQHLAFVPFLLERIATSREHFQSDGLHPNEHAQPILADTVWPALLQLIEARQSGKAAL